MSENATDLKPLGFNMLVSKILPEAKTASGLILPESALKSDGLYTVVDMGNGQMKDGTVFAPLCEVGDIVFIPDYLGTIVPGTDGNYKIVTMDSPIAVKKK